MSGQASRTEASRAAHAVHGDGSRLGWSDIFASALLVLVVAVPALAVEEDWHGRPMIDQPTHLWLIPASLVVAAFLVGGAYAGYRRPSAAALQATAATLLVVTVLVVADVVRRLWLAHEAIPVGVTYRWCLGVVLALLLGAIGSQLGRWIARRPR